MNESKFHSSVEDARKLLNKFNLLKNSDFLNKPISEDFIRISRKENYITAYNTALQSNDYHLLLFDDSFIQFEFVNRSGKTLLRYSYYQFPFDFPTYEEYLKSKYLKEFIEVGYEYKEEYDQALIEAPKKDTFLSIRYDYSEKEYVKGIHSVSHFHIGHGDSVRITSSIFITPMLFMIFIIKNVYSKKWPSLIKDKIFLEQFEKVKTKSERIEECFFNNVDKYELYLI